MKMLSLIVLAATLVGCSDANMGKLGAYGKSRSIECWSGTKMIYKGMSTGKIQSEANSDGYYFVEKGSGKLLEVSGNCILGK